MKLCIDCLKVLMDTLIENSGLADAPVNILIDGQLYDVKEFYFDKDIMEYVMVLGGGYEYKSE